MFRFKISGQSQKQTQVNPIIVRQQPKQLFLSSTHTRKIVPLKITGNKKCSSCGHR